MSTMTREQLLKQIFAMEPSLPRVTTPIDVYVATEKWSRKPVEYFLVLILNGAHQITWVEVVSQGLVNRSLVSSLVNCAFIPAGSKPIQPSRNSTC